MRKIREVRTLHLFTFLLLPAIALAGVVILNVFLFSTDIPTYICLIVLAPSIILGYFLLKRVIIGMVLAYKAFAPMSVRKECRFFPSCSSYMIMAINKYGLFIGVFKGIRRITRCHPPNGGVDYP